MAAARSPNPLDSFDRIRFPARMAPENKEHRQPQAAEDKSNGLNSLNQHDYLARHVPALLQAVTFGQFFQMDDPTDVRFEFPFIHKPGSRL